MLFFLFGAHAFRMLAFNEHFFIALDVPHFTLSLKERSVFGVMMDPGSYLNLLSTPSAHDLRGAPGTC